MTIPPLLNRIKKITPIQTFILIVVIFATLFVVKFYGRTPTERIIKVQVVGQDWTQSFDSFEGFRPPFWLAENIKLGDTEVTPDGGKIAEVIKIEKYERVTSDFEIFLTVKIKGELNARTGSFKFKEKIIKIGDPITLHLERAKVTGQIIDDQVLGTDLSRKEFLVTARVRNVEPWIISKLKPKDFITDAPGGDVIAELISVRTEPASLTFYPGTTRSGVALIERSTRTNDLVLTLSMKVEEHDNLLYFAGFQNVKVGNSINLFFPDVNLFNVEIQNVEEIKS